MMCLLGQETSFAVKYEASFDSITKIRRVHTRAYVRALTGINTQCSSFNYEHASVVGRGVGESTFASSQLFFK